MVVLRARSEPGAPDEALSRHLPQSPLKPGVHSRQRVHRGLGLQTHSQQQRLALFSASVGIEAYGGGGTPGNAGPAAPSLTGAAAPPQLLEARVRVLRALMLLSPVAADSCLCPMIRP